MYLLSSIMMSSTMPSYGSSMMWVHVHGSSQLLGLSVLLQIMSSGMSPSWASGGEGGKRNEILSTYEVVWRPPGATTVAYEPTIRYKTWCRKMHIFTQQYAPNAVWFIDKSESEFFSSIILWDETNLTYKSVESIGFK